MPARTKLNVAKELRKLRVDRLDWSMAKMARQLGYAGSSSYQRWEDEEAMRDRFLPNHLIIRLIANAQHRGEPPIQEDEILRLAENPDFMRPPSPPPPSKYSDTGGPSTETLKRVREGKVLPVLGVVSGEVWREQLIWQDRNWPLIPAAPDPEYDGMQQFALHVEDTSANNIIQPGEFAICIQFADLGRNYRKNDVVVVQRTRGNLVQITLRRVVIAPGDVDIALWHETSDSRYAEMPQKIPRLHRVPPPPPGERLPEDETELAIIGLAVAKYGPL